MEAMNFLKLQALFQSARDKTKGKPIGRNTRIVPMGCGYGIQLHATVVVAFYPEGGFTLNSGGWRTVTTKKRINDAISRDGGAYVFQKNHVWYVRQGNGEVILFQDGMKFDTQGVCVNMERFTEERVAA